MKKIVVIIILVTIIIGGYYIRMNNKKRTTDLSELTPITLRLQWHTQTQFAGYFVALKKGFYQDVGLAVNIEQGGYGKNCIDTVKEGLEEFGTKWMADLVVADASLISLANIVKDNGLMLVSKKEKGINTIEDFKGNKVSIWFIGNEFQLFALLDKNNIPQNDLSIISQKWDLSQFLNDEVDVVAAMSYNELLKIDNLGYASDKLNVFSFRDEGVGFPGQNIFTSTAFYKKNPDVCRKFVEASIKGWEFAIEYPQEATDIVMSYDKENLLEQNHQLQQMKEIIKLIQIDKYPIGIHLKQDYQFIESTFKKYKIIDEKTNIHNLYTNDLIQVQK